MLILLLAVGLFLFLGGLRLMSSGLENLCGSSFAAGVQHFTGNRFSAFLCGLIFSGLTQSSSLVTVVLVGVVNAGIIGLRPAIAVMIGANVGTTVTGQMISFDLYEYALYFAVAGAILIVAGRQRHRQVGRALLGLGVLLFGLENMGGALAPLAESKFAQNLLSSAAVYPLTGIFAGAALTALIQSSSAVVAMAISLAKEGVLSLAAGAAVIVGADVGTCVTTLLAGLGTGIAARRTAFAHLFFNLCSVLLVLPFFSLFIRLAAASSDALPRQLANAHTLYNLGGAILLLLFWVRFRHWWRVRWRREIGRKKGYSAGLAN